MGKSVHPDVLDGALAVIRDNVTRMVALSGAPADFADADSNALASVTIAAGDFTLSAGTASGRKASVAAKADVPVASDGDADHVALLDMANSRLLYVTTCAAQTLSAGGTVSLSGWTIEIADPV